MNPRHQQKNQSNHCGTHTRPAGSRPSPRQLPTPPTTPQERDREEQNAQRRRADRQQRAQRNELGAGEDRRRRQNAHQRQGDDGQDRTPPKKLLTSNHVRTQPNPGGLLPVSVTEELSTVGVPDK